MNEVRTICIRALRTRIRMLQTRIQTVRETGAETTHVQQTRIETTRNVLLLSASQSDDGVYLTD